MLMSCQILPTSFGKKCLTICKESLHFELGNLPYLAFGKCFSLPSEDCRTSKSFLVFQSLHDYFYSLRVLTELLLCSNTNLPETTKSFYKE